METEKYFGVFRICCKYGKADETKEKMYLVRGALEKKDSFFFNINTARGGATQDKEQLKNLYFAQKQWVRHEESLSRGGSYHYVIFKHQCDSQGRFLPTKKEIAEYDTLKKVGAI